MPNAKWRPLQNWSAELRFGAKRLTLPTRRFRDRRSESSAHGFCRGLQWFSSSGRRATAMPNVGGGRVLAAWMMDEGVGFPRCPKSNLSVGAAAERLELRQFLAAWFMELAFLVKVLVIAVCRRPYKLTRQPPLTRHCYSKLIPRWCCQPIQTMTHQITLSF